MSASENGPENRGWKPGKRDAFFLAFVAAVVIFLTMSGERTTKPTPNDATHQQAAALKTIAACMACHSADGIHPQPKRHTKTQQCFQCHIEPEMSVGAK
jgi:hypothetical protein